MSDVAAVHALRCACWENGYRPIAIYSPEAQLRNGTAVKGTGKRPVTKDWLKLAPLDPPDAVKRAASSLAPPMGQKGRKRMGRSQKRVVDRKQRR